MPGEVLDDSLAFDGLPTHPNLDAGVEELLEELDQVDGRVRAEVALLPHAVDGRGLEDRADDLLTRHGVPREPRELRPHGPAVGDAPAGPGAIGRRTADQGNSPARGRALEYLEDVFGLVRAGHLVRRPADEGRGRPSGRRLNRVLPEPFEVLNHLDDHSVRS